MCICIRLISACKRSVKSRVVVIGNVVYYLPIVLVPILVCQMHLVRSVRDEALDSIRMFLELLYLLTECASEPLVLCSLKIAQTVRFDVFCLAEVNICIICSPLSPVMVCPEVYVFCVMASQPVYNRNTRDFIIYLSIQIIESLLLVACPHILNQLVIEHYARCRRCNDKIHIDLVSHSLCDLVQRSCERTYSILCEIVEFIPRISIDIDAVALLTLLRYRSVRQILVRFIYRFLFRLLRDVLCYFSLPFYNLIASESVEFLKVLIHCNKAFPRRESVGIPCRYLIQIISVPEGRPCNLREFSELSFFEHGCVRS